MTFPRPLLSVHWLADHYRDNDLVLIDCRFAMAQPESGRQAYAAGHIPGATYLHLDQDLAGPIGQHGGRHPLPDPATIAPKLGAAGIGPGVKVVVYDWTGEHAARCWWVLRWLGHDEVAVLDGGFSAWTAAGLPVTAEPSSPFARTFTPRPRPEMVVDMKGARDRVGGEVLVDARSVERFAGQPNPLDAKLGHIPGSLNRFWQGALRPDGTWRPAAEQAARFAELPPAALQIHSCGSGVTACANLLALEIAGRQGARLYAGSWSDWCTYDENEVER